MVSFHDNPEKYNGPVMANYIDEEVRRSIKYHKGEVSIAKTFCKFHIKTVKVSLLQGPATYKK